ncbi:MAG: type II toxin-antitoxin system RelE/ParE family toxin [Planctomycetaceae bacterium]
MALHTLAMATVIVTPEAQQQLDGLPVRIHARVRQLLIRLEKWPEVSGAKPLSGKLAGHYRMRTGDYRLQFRVKGETVIVEKIGHRDRFYDD